jgi:hypothetical protein
LCSLLVLPFLYLLDSIWLLLLLFILKRSEAPILNGVKELVKIEILGLHSGRSADCSASPQNDTCLSSAFLTDTLNLKPVELFGIVMQDHLFGLITDVSAFQELW